MANAVHRGLKAAVGRDHDDFDFGMRALDVMQEVRSGTIRQFQIQRHEIDAVVVDDGQGCMCIFRREYVEVLLEDLCEGRARSTLIVDDQDGRPVVGSVGGENRRHAVTCIVMHPTGQ